MTEYEPSYSAAPLRVFLCHSSDDKQTIRKLRRRLQDDGFRPWLDEVDIKPGDDWDTAIRHAVRASHIVAVCVSTSSVGKSGYLQKEIRFALDIADEKPDGAVFIIPVRLEACDIPERLSRWQYVNLFESDGYERLSTALRAQAEMRLVEGFVKSSGHERNHLGGSLMRQAFPEDSAITPDNAEDVAAEAIYGLSSGARTERVHAALRLTNRCFITGGRLAFLTKGQQQRLTKVLALALDRDEATQCAALWALLWLTGARNRIAGSSDRQLDCVLLDQSLAEKIDALLQSPGLDSNTVKFGCLVLTRESGVRPIADQVDWMYELAFIADGAKPRRGLQPPNVTGRRLSTSWMKHLLISTADADVRSRIAQTLGAFGDFIAELREPLRSLFLDPANSLDDRDEAMLYLAMSGVPGTSQILVQAADTVPVGKDDYLHTRGVLGLLLLDDIDILAQQLRKDLAHADPRPYAFGLAGSVDLRGRDYLEQLSKSGSRRSRDAVSKALSTVWR
jgi:hypothetical protein